MQKNLTAALYSSRKSQLPLSLRKIQNTWWENFARDVQAATDSSDSKKLYHFIEQVYSPKTSATANCLSNDSSIYLAGIIVRLMEYISSPKP